MLQPISPNASAAKTVSKARDTAGDAADPAFALAMASLIPTQSHYKALAPNPAQPSTDTQKPSQIDTHREVQNQKRQVNSAVTQSKQPEGEDSQPVDVKKPPSERPNSEEKVDTENRDAKGAETASPPECQEDPPRTPAPSTQYHYEAASISQPGPATTASLFATVSSAVPGTETSTSPSPSTSSIKDDADMPNLEANPDQNATATLGASDFKQQLNQEISLLTRPSSGTSSKPLEAMTANLSIKNQIFITEQGLAKPTATVPGKAASAEAKMDTPASPLFREFLASPKPDMEVPRPLQEIALKTVPPAPTEVQNSVNSKPDSLLASLGISLTSGTAESKDGFSAFNRNPAHPAPAENTAPTISPVGPHALSQFMPALEKTTERSTLSATVLNQVDSSIKWMVSNNVKGAEIQLNPDSLGKLVIQVKVEGSEVHAKVWASESATVPLLQEHRQTLENSLRQQGLSLGSFDLQQGRHDGTRFANHSMNHSFQRVDLDPALNLKLPADSIPIPANLGGARLLEVLA